ncbi:MAG: right-handed parallel beta-helix repeat-containing protein [Capsulimonadaceae bacterium]|nr:right-handed parallel beta-helix repeat-containing protein [Capsulimonadaceae bacterium]
MMLRPLIGCCFSVIVAGLTTCFGSASVSFPAGGDHQSAKGVVGNPAAPAALGQAVQDAYAAGVRMIVINPGTYLVPAENRDMFRMEGWKDTTISAYGVTIITAERPWPSAIFDMRHCMNVTVAGPLLSQTALTAYQGRVTATGSTSQGEFYCDWTSDFGYPIMPAEMTKRPSLNVVDARTRKLKVGTGDFYSTKWQSLGNNAFRISGFHGRPLIDAGDWLVARNECAIACKVHLDGCEHCTIKDVSMMRNGFAPIFETGGGGNRILGCKWLLGPRPAGATEEPLVSTMADGLHSVGTTEGPDIEDCTMEGVLLDDCIAIHGSFSDLVSSAGSKLIAKGHASFFAGDPIVGCDKKGFFAQGKVVAVEHNVDGAGTCTIVTDIALNAPPETKLYNPSACGAGYKIINCHIGDTRSRGILAKANSGLIKGNTIVRCGMSAVSLGPEFWWGEAGYVQHVTVERNKIDQCGGAGYGGAAILLHGDGAIGNGDVNIRDNQVSSSYQGDVQIEWSHDVTVSGNAFSGANPWPEFFKRHPVVQLSNDQGVSLETNIVRNAAAYTQEAVAVRENVTGLSHNDARGIRPAIMNR